MKGVATCKTTEECDRDLRRDTYSSPILDSACKDKE